jgi:hypothetical protein
MAELYSGGRLLCFHPVRLRINKYIRVIFYAHYSVPLSPLACTTGDISVEAVVVRVDITVSQITHIHAFIFA